MTTYDQISDPFGIESGNLFEYWLSLWPVAPWFGVEWRFAPLFVPEAQAADTCCCGPKNKAPEAAVAIVAVPVAAAPAALMDTAPESADDLKLIKGIGPKLERQLNGLGVHTFAQIAGFTDADLAWIDDHLTAFKGRCFRDDWAAQAKALLG